MLHEREDRRLIDSQQILRHDVLHTEDDVKVVRVGEDIEPTLVGAGRLGAVPPPVQIDNPASLDRASTRLDDLGRLEAGGDPIRLSQSLD